MGLQTDKLVAEAFRVVEHALRDAHVEMVDLRYDGDDSEAEPGVIVWRNGCGDEGVTLFEALQNALNREDGDGT